MPISQIVTNSIANGAVAQVDLATGVAGTGPLFNAYASANQAPTINVSTKASVNTIIYDTASCFNTSTYRFTPNVAGYYQMSGCIAGYSTNTSLIACYTYLVKNGSTNFAVGAIVNIASSLLLQPTACGVIYLNGTTDYVELYGLVNANTSGSQLFLGSSQIYTNFSGCLIKAA